MKEDMIRMRTIGYHDMFSVKDGGLENLTVLEINGMTLAIEAPAHITATLPNMKDVISKSDLTKVDALAVTHVDADHVAGLDSLIWHKVFGEKKKLQIITHRKIYKQLWQRIRTAFEISRVDMRSRMKFEDYVEFVGLPLGKTTEIEQLGIEIETFYRSTAHAPFLSIAFRILKKERPILAYSGDTSFDPELIDFLAKSGKHYIIHEIGSYSVGTKSHTHIEEVLALPEAIQKRLFINHIPKALEQNIRKRIKETNSPIRTADELK